jgi:hypothetical protein
MLDIKHHLFLLDDWIFPHGKLRCNTALTYNDFVELLEGATFTKYVYGLFPEDEDLWPQSWLLQYAASRIK